MGKPSKSTQHQVPEAKPDVRTADDINKSVDEPAAPKRQVRSMKNIGFAIDFAFIAGVVYIISQYPIWRDIQQQGLVQVISSLPTPINPMNASGILIEMNSRYQLVSPSTALVSQQWYNYIAGDDRGTRGTANPDTEYFASVGSMLNSWVLPRFINESLPHAAASWMRNLLAGWALYFITGGLWCLWIYRIKASKYFKSAADMPTKEDLWAQIDVSTSALVIYTWAPTFGEWLMERGWTYAFAGIGDVGGPLYWLGLTAAYLLFVEWGIYWAHRFLHVRAVYWLHKPHHIYSNRNVLSPFAGLAFHPIDGLIQACPYTIGLFMLPVHFWTHLVMLFFTAVWTTNIHDTLTGDTEPVMGSAYHTIHHTAYDYNYGQIFILFDWLHDTLVPPPHRKAQWGWEGRAAFMRGKQESFAKIHAE